ncbi:MAG: phosphodiesterase, partial [Mycobacterium sp.]|nr:phosphodiesterase [Mycobacterium sp.]
LNGFVEDITEFLQGVVDQEIFLISTLAQVAELAVGFIGGALVDVTQVIAGVVARLTGSGVIPPSDLPLPPPTSASLSPAAAVPPSVLV